MSKIQNSVIGSIGVPAGGGGTTILSPSNIAGGPSVWLAADFLSLLHDDLVSTWTDKSTAGNDATQSTEQNQPIFKTNVINSLPVIAFDGIDNFMDILTASGVDMGTVFCIGDSLSQADNTFDNFNGLFGAATGVQTDTFLLADDNQSRFRAASQGAGSEVWVDGVKQVSFADINEFHLVSAVWDGTPPTPANLIIGRDRDNGDRSWGGCIAELILYETVLSDADRQNIEQYLSNKYNLGLSIV